MDLYDNLENWRKERNINKANTYSFVANTLEELLEIYYSEKKDIKRIQAEIMVSYFSDIEPISEHNTIDSIEDIKVFGSNEVANMGYSNEMCDNEVFKEINSRKQDPIQKKEWEEFGSNGKWLKDINQKKDTMYIADYNKCKTYSAEE